MESKLIQPKLFRMMGISRSEKLLKIRAHYQKPRMTMISSSSFWTLIEKFYDFTVCGTIEQTFMANWDLLWVHVHYRNVSFAIYKLSEMTSRFSVRIIVKAVVILIIDTDNWCDICHNCPCDDIVRTPLLFMFVCFYKEKPCHSKQSLAFVVNYHDQVFLWSYLSENVYVSL